jgi:hypothetical protein
VSASAIVRAERRVAAKRITENVKMHFEAKEGSYEKIKVAFDDVRASIDAGMTGNVDEWTALRKARSSLFTLGQLVQDNVAIVQDPQGSQEQKGGH